MSYQFWGHTLKSGTVAAFLFLATQHAFAGCSVNDIRTEPLLDEIGRLIPAIKALRATAKGGGEAERAVADEIHVTVREAITVVQVVIDLNELHSIMLHPTDRRAVERILLQRSSAVAQQLDEDIVYLNQTIGLLRTAGASAQAARVSERYSQLQSLMQKCR